MKKGMVLGFALAVIFLSPRCAQAAAQKKAVVPAATDTTTAAPAQGDQTSTEPTPVTQAPVEQAPSDAAPAQGGASADAGQAPDAATKKISELVHAGKYADAQQLTTGLLLAYPNDQRLIRAQALIAKLIAGGGSAANNSQPAPSTADTSAEQLTGMDKVDYNALIELARQAQGSTDLDEQNRLLQQFMEESNTFLVKHPEQMLLWQLRAASAISMNEPMNGYRAGTKLIAMGAADSNDPNLQQLLAKLQLLGWLDSYKVQELQYEVDVEQKKQAETDASAKNTFAVVHLDGLHYEYGHLTINPDEAIYVGTDETAHIARSNIRDVSVACNTDGCGMYFTQKAGRRFYFLAVTEDAVTNKSTKGPVFRPPSVIGNAVVARWKFVASGKNNKTLSPAPEGGAVPAAVPSAQKSTPSPPAPEAASANVSVAANDPAPVATVEAATGPAILHVYRPHHMTGAMEKFDVSVDGKKLAQLENSQMVRLVVMPGRHNISVEGKHMDDKIPVDDFDMAAGVEYWIKVDVDSGAFSAHTELSVVPAAQAEGEAKGFKDVSAEGEKKK